MSEEEFAEGMRDGAGEDNEDDVMFMSMQDFKKKLDMMSMQRWVNKTKNDIIRASAWIFTTHIFT